MNAFFSTYPLPHILRIPNTRKKYALIRAYKHIFRNNRREQEIRRGWIVRKGCDVLYHRRELSIAFLCCVHEKWCFRHWSVELQAHAYIQFRPDVNGWQTRPPQSRVCTNVGFSHTSQNGHITDPSEPKEIVSGHLSSFEAATQMQQSHVAILCLVSLTN